jgi:hypothetical protein
VKTGCRSGASRLSETMAVLVFWSAEFPEVRNESVIFRMSDLA